MKSVTKGNIKAAIASVRTTKGRSFLTMLGIIIGVASVITVVGIGQGVKQQVSKQINQLGKDLITIRAGHTEAASLDSVLNQTGVSSAGGILTDKDVTTAQHTAGVSAAAPLAVVPGSVRGDHTAPSSVVIGTTGMLASVINQNEAYGRFFTADSGDDSSVVLGASAAQQLFDDEVPLGRSLTFRGQTFTVRAIMNEFDTAPFSSEIDFNNAIFIPYQTAKQLTDNHASPYEILVKPVSSDKVASVEAALQRNLRRTHSDPNDFSVLQQSQSRAATNSILDLLTRLIAGVAAVSLLVGGIGIMNVMLVSVTERMHEIGIRKAVGATNRQILSQFMIESTVLSVAGGIIGIILAFIIDIVLHLLTSLAPDITWQIVLLASGVSLLVGIIFGSAPALKAARKDPISALRNE
jgi:putative ABC transport system permease protein